LPARPITQSFKPNGRRAGRGNGIEQKIRELILQERKTIEWYHAAVPRGSPWRSPVLQPSACGAGAGETNPAVGPRGGRSVARAARAAAHPTPTPRSLKSSWWPAFSRRSSISGKPASGFGPYRVRRATGRAVPASRAFTPCYAANVGDEVIRSHFPNEFTGRRPTIHLARSFAACARPTARTPRRRSRSFPGGDYEYRFKRRKMRARFCITRMFEPTIESSGACTLPLVVSGGWRQKSPAIAFSCSTT
jgi:hypothetical protein